MKMIQTDWKGTPITIACVHWKTFPPAVIASGEGKNADELRALGLLGENEHQQALVWERVCGLFSMQAGKCLTCPHVRVAGVKNYLPVLSTLDGSLATTVIDLPSLECSSKHRKAIEGLK
jgi:hypothetical protein